MNCMNCGAVLTDSAYCPQCGLDISVQKQAIILSGLYYNQGLEKAQIRDLSGAIDQLRRALKFNKMNIDARNLLGLVYFETGEVVAALSEWVISKNLREEDNLASYYIKNLQQDANRLDVINQTIKKFNIALESCREGHEDMAVIQLKKILAQNPKLIKGYHLLALLYIREQEFERARKLLKKALKIDRTNTTTLRYLAEIEEQTGEKQEEAKKPGIIRMVREGRKKAEGAEPAAPAAVSAERPPYAGLLNIITGIAIGAAVVGFVFLPSAMRRVNVAANERIAGYSEETARMGAKINELNDRIDSSQQTVAYAYERINEATQRANSSERLADALRSYFSEEYDDAATALADVEPSLLSERGLSSYNMLANSVSDRFFARLKDKGDAAMASEDYRTAVSAYGRAKEINGEDEELSRSLTDAQAKLAEQMANESGVAVISAQPAQEGTPPDASGASPDGEGTGENGGTEGGEANNGDNGDDYGDGEYGGDYGEG